MGHASLGDRRAERHFRVTFLTRRGTSPEFHSSETYACHRSRSRTVLVNTTVPCQIIGKMVRPPSLELGTPGLGNREHGTISLRI